MTKETVGIMLLGLGTAAGIWSCTNSSIFTMREFVATEEDVKKAREAMTIGLVLCVLVGAGIYFVYKQPYAAASVALFGVGFYLYYDHLIKKTQEEETK